MIEFIQKKKYIHLPTKKKEAFSLFVAGTRIELETSGL